MTVKDFHTLRMLRNSPGFVNDEIINAFPQILHQAVANANPRSATSPTHVFLSTFARNYLAKAAAGDLATFKSILEKHGVTSGNLSGIENVYFPVNIPTYSNGCLRSGTPITTP